MTTINVSEGAYKRGQVGSIDIWAGAIDIDAAKFGSNELEQIISMLSCEKEAMRKQRNFPPIYDEILSDLINVQREHDGVKNVKGETNSAGIISKIDEDALYTLCELYDEKEGPYPENVYEGVAVYRFFRKLSAEGTRMKPGFANYIEGNATTGSLREMFYSYFIAHLGKLPEDDRACEVVIKEGMARFFYLNRKR
jgi:hypothetical protein